MDGVSADVLPAVYCERSKGVVHGGTDGEGVLAVLGRDLVRVLCTCAWICWRCGFAVKDLANAI